MKDLFCNIAWMQRYKDVRDIDVPQNGGAYVNQYHTGSEVDNFWPLENTLPESLMLLEVRSHVKRIM